MNSSLAISVFVLLAIQLVIATSNPLVVTTQFGQIQGYADSFNGTALNIWKGVPFAKPPTGSLRWTSPQAPARWSGVKVTNASSLPCVQSNTSATSSEDCLYLDIYVPSNPSVRGPLPVLLWVFGGAYLTGSNAAIDGRYMAGDDMIFVAINYRLGMMGYFAHEALAASSTHNSGIGFYGVQDIGFSAEWVHNNIAAFGGDVNRVTLGGQSAGSFGICALIATAQGQQGYFQQLLMDSTHCTVDTQEEGLTRGNSLASALGCDGLSDSAALTCLLGKSQAEIYNAQAAYSYGTIPYQALTTRFWPSAWPAYNGLTDQPAVILSSGKGLRVPMLIGNEFNESAVYDCPTLININGSYANSLLLQELNSQSTDAEAISAVENFYDIASWYTPIAGFNTFQTDFVYKCHAFNLASAFYASGQPVYMYVVEHAIAYYLSTLKTTALQQCYGVPHGSDLYYYGYSLTYFNNLTPVEYALSQVMHKAWHSFVSTGAPSLSSVGLSWPKYTTSTRQYVGYNVSATAPAVAIGTGLKQTECTLLNAALGGSSLNQPGYNPTCQASVSLVARSGAWPVFGETYQIFDLEVVNTGDSKISALEVTVALNGAAVTGSWNLEKVSANTYALPSWYQGFGVDASSDTAGFILSTKSTFNPTVTVSSISC